MTMMMMVISISHIFRRIKVFYLSGCDEGGKSFNRGTFAGLELHFSSTALDANMTSVDEEDGIWVLMCLTDFKEYEIPIDGVLDSTRLRDSGYEEY